MSEQIQNEGLTNDDAKFPVKIRKFSRNLKVTLTDAEKIDRIDRAAYLKGEIEQREEEMSSAKKQAQARIDELQSEFDRLMLELRDRSIFTDVACEERFIYRTGEVVEVRVDVEPEQIIGRRPMTDRERQPELPLDAKSQTVKEEPAADQLEESEDDADDDESDASDDGIVDDDYNPHAADVEEEPDTSILDAKSDDSSEPRDTEIPPPPELATEKKPKGKGGKGSKKKGGDK